MSTLNERIAAVKGWRITAHEGEYNKSIGRFRPTGRIHCNADDGRGAHAHNWSGSIADAWELVEELAAKNYEPRIDYCNDGSWLVGLVVDDEELPEVADTAPEAISAAYLAAMEGQP